MLNFSKAYEESFLKSLLFRVYPKGHEIPGDLYAESWANLNRFEKLCWCWERLNDFGLHNIQHVSYARAFKFENIFGGVTDEFNSTSQLDVMTDFLCEVVDLEKGFCYHPETTLSANHQSTKDFPHWRLWDAAKTVRLYEICGPLMERLGYGTEPEWLAKLAKAKGSSQVSGECVQ